MTDGSLSLSERASLCLRSPSVGRSETAWKVHGHLNSDSKMRDDTRQWLAPSAGRSYASLSGDSFAKGAGMASNGTRARSR
jgi:hypothetical protein